MGIACSPAAIFFMWWLTTADWTQRWHWQRSKLGSFKLYQALMSATATVYSCPHQTEETKTISGNRPSSCSIHMCNRTMIHWGTAHLHQQISHHALNTVSALPTMKTWIIRFSFLSLFLTIEPRDADGFNKHSKENRCSCCKVVQQSEHIHPTLEKYSECIIIVLLY